jgi:hypothetical protein
MNRMQAWKQWLTAGALLAALVLTAFAMFPQATFAQTDDTAAGEETTTESAMPAMPFGRSGMRGHMMDFGMRGFDLGAARGEYQTFLADALGITVEELEAAQLKAREAMVAQAVEDGVITQEQADLMAAGQAFRQYYTEENAQSFEDALTAAVEAGAITQEQADLLLDARTQMGRGMFGDGGLDGRGSRGGSDHRGMMPGYGNRMMPANPAPAATPEANS